MAADPLAELYQQNLFGEYDTPDRSGALAQEFDYPPFSVLNAREGTWQDRKRLWISLGIQSEIGRGAHTEGDDGSRASYAQAYPGQARLSAIQRGDKAGSDSLAASSGVSIFDPVLTEVAYKWFCPAGGWILDPFAGGSVRGIVAAKLGYVYWGSDLREEQIEANVRQGQELCPGAPLWWVAGDSLDTLDGAPQADFLFTCPPYGDLEVYCDDPRDISTMPYGQFLATLGRILGKAARKLKRDRFAAIVVGDFRDKRTGLQRGFVADTVALGRAVGLHLYNEVVLLTAVGTAAVRAGGPFRASRKLCKVHQQMLVFVKGDGKAAAQVIARAQDDADNAPMHGQLDFDGGEVP